jgi:hypothetical protein
VYRYVRTDVNAALCSALPLVWSCRPLARTLTLTLASLYALAVDSLSGLCTLKFSH